MAVTEDKSERSFKYTQQAQHYNSDAAALNLILDDVIKCTNDVKSNLAKAYKDVKNDFFTKQISDNNDNIVTDVGKIRDVLSSTSSQLMSRASYFDEQENKQNETSA